jgi:hypothetical protein
VKSSPSLALVEPEGFRSVPLLRTLLATGSDFREAARTLLVAGIDWRDGMAGVVQEGASDPSGVAQALAILAIRALDLDPGGDGAVRRRLADLGACPLAVALGALDLPKGAVFATDPSRSQAKDLAKRLRADWGSFRLSEEGWLCAKHRPWSWPKGLEAIPTSMNLSDAPLDFVLPEGLFVAGSLSLRRPMNGRFFTEAWGLRSFPERLTVLENLYLESMAWDGRVPDGLEVRGEVMVDNPNSETVQDLYVNLTLGAWRDAVAAQANLVAQGVPAKEAKRSAFAAATILRTSG